MIFRFLLLGLIAASAVHCNVLDDIWSLVEDVASDVEEVVSGIEDTIEDTVEDIGDEVAAVLDPIGDILAVLIFSQCDLIKSALGITYEDIDYPDISSLELIYRNESFEVTMNLTTAAEMISTNSHTFQQNVYFILHGFIASPDSDTTAELNQALIDLGNTNVFMLDATSLIQFFYLRSTVYIQYIGEALAEVIYVLYQHGVDPKNIHLIAHSLGAHTAGYAGRTFTNLTGETIGRISALDPAGPCFTDIDTFAKLNNTDADFVDVLHTNAGLAGYSDALGHIDYYPNGGSLQPGCYEITCNHGRSWEFYTESLYNATKFPSVKCETYNEYKAGGCAYNVSHMGFNSNASDIHGTYYLMTGEDSLFDLGADGLAYDASTIVQWTVDVLIQLFSGVGDVIGMDLGDFATSLLT